MNTEALGTFVGDALAKGNEKRWSKKEEHKKMSKFIAKRNSKDNFRTGKTLSEGVKKTISDTMKEWWAKPENRKVQSDSHKGNKGYWKDRY